MNHAAPFGEIHRHTSRFAALSTVTAAVVGVVLNLAVWFALNALFPGGHAIDWFAAAICLSAFVAMFRYKVDIIPVVLGSGLVGLIYKILV